MAVSANPVNSRLSLIVQTGTNESGQPVYRTRSYSRVKVNAGDQFVYETGVALAGAQKHPLQSIRRTNELELAEISA